MTVLIDSDNVLTSQGIPVTVRSTAIVKIVNEKSALKKACAMFVGMKEKEVIDFVKEALDGHQRSVIGRMSVGENYFKREELSQQVMDGAKKDMDEMGVTIVSHQVDQVADASGIIEDILRMKRVEGQAVIRLEEAEARKQSALQSIRDEEEYQLLQQKVQSACLAQSADLQLKRLSNDIQVARSTASSHMEPVLQAVTTRRLIQNELLDAQLLQTETAVVQEEANVIRSLSELVKDALETEAHVAAETSLSRAHNFRTVCEAEAKAAAIIDSTTKVGASDVREADLLPAVQPASSGADGQERQFADEGQGTSGRGVKGETRETHSHEVEDNYESCASSSSPADLESCSTAATEGAFSSNEDHEEVRVA